MSPWERAASAASKKASARPVAKETEKSKKAEERKTIKKRAPIVKFKNGDYIHDPESEEYKYSYVKAMPMEPGTFLSAPPRRPPPAAFCGPLTAPPLAVR
jgi:hypothetical protein